MFIRKFLLAFFLVALFVITSPPSSYSVKSVSKQELLTKYENAINLAEELNIYQEDLLQVLPKIRLVSQTLLRNDLEGADRILDEVLSDLKLLKAKKPKEPRNNLRLEWLEIYIEVFQKYALLVLLAYLFIRWPFFQGMLKVGKLSSFGNILFTLLISFFSILLSFIDLSRYGESAWAFFDIQVVLLAIGGLLGGVWPGLFSSLSVGAFRWFLKPGAPVYVVIVIVAGLLSGFLSRKIKNIQSTGRISFLTGFLVGALHGILIYLPTVRLMPWTYLLFSILFLALLEGSGVFIFMAVISAILREETTREIENELLKTKLLFLQAQMRPHFLFNALNTLSSICGKENALQARGLVLRLADFLRTTLKRAGDKVTLKEETAYIDSYLEIEKARFQDRLKIEKSYQISDSGWTAEIPILTLQPLVENAIHHGIGKKEAGGTLCIKMEDRDNLLTVEIMDNGVGADLSYIQRLLQGKESSSEGLGIGINNIHQRLIRLYGLSYGLQFESQPGIGTKVTVKIPLKKQGVPS